MPTVNKSALVPASAGEMYALVNDVEAYPRFLPWCGAARVHHQDQHEMQATIEIRKGGLNQAFTTRNRLQPPRHIHIELVDGPFRELYGDWRFEPLREDACRVSLKLVFSFSSSLVRVAVEPIFHQIANSLLDAFCQRARELRHG